MIKIDYSLSVSPPPDAAADTRDLSASKSHTFEIKHKEGSSYKEYYVGLREALANARNTLGEELTRWKELVGKDEEWKKGVKQNEKEDEEEEEDEQ